MSESKELILAPPKEGVVETKADQIALHQMQKMLRFAEMYGAGPNTFSKLLSNRGKLK